MAFALGGLRYREQVCFAERTYDDQNLTILQLYNSTVTQMSACLLSLSVMSLLLPVRPLRAIRGRLLTNALDCFSRFLL